MCVCNSFCHNAMIKRFIETHKKTGLPYCCDLEGDIYLGEKKLKQTTHHGYKEVGINRKVQSAHRLMCRAWHGEPPTPAHVHVDHADGDKTNNTAANLQWRTRRQNARNHRRSRDADPMLNISRVGSSWRVEHRLSKRNRSKTFKNLEDAQLFRDEVNAKLKKATGQEDDDIINTTYGERMRGSYKKRKINHQPPPPTPGDDWQPLMTYKDHKLYHDATEPKFYVSSSSGQAWNAFSGNMIKQQLAANGYSTLTIYFGDYRTNPYVHRLVALAHIPNPEDKPCVDHINGDKQDNSVTNLRWASAKENAYNRECHRELKRRTTTTIEDFFDPRREEGCPTYSSKEEAPMSTILPQPTTTPRTSPASSSIFPVI